MLGWAPPPGAGRASAPPRCPTSTEASSVSASGRPARPGRRSRRWGRRTGTRRPPERAPAGRGPCGAGRARRVGWSRRCRVPGQAQRLGQLCAGARVAEVGGLDLDEGPAAQRFGELRSAGGSRTRRPWEETSSGTVSVHSRQACSTSPQRGRSGRTGSRRTGRRPGTGESPVRSPRPGCRSPARPRTGPPVVGVGAYQVAVRGDQFGCGDAVGGQPLAASQPAPARRRGWTRSRPRWPCGPPGGRGVLGGRDGHLLPHRAGPRRGRCGRPGRC